MCQICRPAALPLLTRACGDGRGSLFPLRAFLAVSETLQIVLATQGYSMMFIESGQGGQSEEKLLRRCSLITQLLLSNSILITSAVVRNDK